MNTNIPAARVFKSVVWRSAPWDFGELTGDTASFGIMDAALAAGINFFDTANVYGGPQAPEMEKGFGTAEEIIGRWLAQGGRRGRIVLATKVYQPMAPARTM
jgi:aryl-alcohol dehydrogenase-like predicted oxidoreductase